ncbi:hypothetical protein [Actinomadura sp. 3N508]
MRNLVIRDQSWTMSETPDELVEAPEVKEQESEESEYTLSFSYARV